MITNRTSTKRNRRRGWFIGIVLSALTISACAGDDSRSVGDDSTTSTSAASTPPATVPATTLPSPIGDSEADLSPAAGSLRIDLDQSTNYGYIVAFENLPDETQAVVDQVEAAAIERGMSTTRLLIDWSEIESAPGVYDLAPLTESLEAVQARGLTAFVTFSTLDSEGFTIPEDLLLDEVTLANSMSPNDPVIIDRLRNVLDVVVPVLVEHDVFVLAVANEPRNWLNDNEAETAAVAAMLEAGLDHVHAIEPNLPVGVTLTSTDLGAPFVSTVIAASDVAIFNVACLDEVLVAKDLLTATSIIDDLTTAAGDREIVLQEFGCPPGVPGASDQYQQQYLDSMFQAFEAEPLVRAVYMFQLVDWSGELATRFSQPLLDEGLTEVGQNLYAWLSTTGLIEFDDGTVRPGLTSLLHAISRSSGSPISESEFTASLDRSDLVRLDAGPHLAVSWLAPSKPEAVPTMLGFVQDAESAGSDIGRVLIDWVEIEPSAGAYDLDELIEQLDSMAESQIQPSVTISVLGDSDQYLPSYLGDWTDTDEVADAYGRLLEVVVPILSDYDVWALSIANEPETAMSDGFLTADDFQHFAELTVDKAHSLDPELAMTATLGSFEVLNEEPYVGSLIGEFDVVMLNHYCLTNDFTVVAMSEVEGRFDTLVVAAGDSPIVFQELGCPASEQLGSSDSFQASWFEVALGRVLDDQQIRAAYVFELLDWSPELIASFYGDFVAIPGIGQNLEQWLLTTGLVNQEDSNPRPAWDVFIGSVSATSGR